MGVERGEVELAGDEEENGAHGSEPRIASGLALGGLEEPIQGLDEAVGLAGLGPTDDAIEMLADHPGDLLHRLDPGTQNIGAPLPEQGGDDVDLLAFEDFAQMLAIEPGARGAFACCLGDQGVEIGPAFGGQAVTILEQCPAQSLEAGVGALFEAPGLIDGGGRVGDDVELVEGDAGVGQMLADALDEGGRHVDAHRADLLGCSVVLGQVFGEAGDSLGVLPLGDEHHLALFGVGGNGQVIVAAPRLEPVG